MALCWFFETAKLPAKYPGTKDQPICLTSVTIHDPIVAKASGFVFMSP